MATLDVSRVINDPRFFDRGLVCNRNTQTINDKGRAVNTPASTPFSAIVTANDGLKLDRMPDGSIVSGAINVVTRFRLTQGIRASDADEITWRGNKYTVMTVKDYSHFGRGFVKAVCTLKSLKPSG